MAACNLGGVSNIKVFDLYQDKKIKYSKLVTSYKTKAIRLERFNGLKGIQIRNEPMNVASFVWKTRRSACSFVVSCGLLPRRNDTKEEIFVAKPSISDRTIPVPSEVLSLLTTVCDTTSIAEFKLDLSGFRLYVKRNLDNEDIQSPGPSLPVIQSSTSNQTPDLNGTVATASLVTSNTKPSSAGIQSILDAASDEGLVILQSPKVGLFRRSRTVKGKRAPPSCKEKQEVKEGQVLCFIEQLGGEIPIEADVSGEVIKILREDGEPVGYGDALMAILPSFPGIKKLQ